MTFEITVVAKAGGPLTKRISLDVDGSLKSDGSACVMSQGSVRRFEFGHVRELAALLERLNSHQATALGRLRADLPAAVEITTKRKLNGADRPGVIARTRDYIDYRPGEPAFALVDYDTKGIPPGVTAKIEELGGGLWPALLSVVPALEDAARVMRRSTSAGGPILATNWRDRTAYMATSRFATARTSNASSRPCTFAAGWPASDG